MEWSIVILWAGFVYATHAAYTASKKIEGLEFARDNTWSRLTRIEEELRAEVGALNYQVDRLEAELREARSDEWRDPSQAP